MKRLFPAAVFFLLFLAAPLFALSVPDKPESYVNDYASLLSEGAKQKLEAQLADFEKQTSNQVLVAIFPSLEGQVLEDFSIRLAEKWKIGTKKNDNGIILLVFRDDRAVRIEVGYGLEGALPDATARMIIEHEIVPSFRQKDFDGGVARAVDSIIQATKGEYKAPAGGPSEDYADKYAPWVFFAMAAFFLMPFICYILLTVFFVQLFGLPGFFLAVLLSAVLDFFRRLYLAPLRGTTFSGGSGSWGGSGGGFSGGGGFGGGGGGSFGGGGASGRW